MPELNNLTNRLRDLKVGGVEKVIGEIESHKESTRQLSEEAGEKERTAESDELLEVYTTFENYQSLIKAKVSALIQNIDLLGFQIGDFVKNCDPAKIGYTYEEGKKGYVSFDNTTGFDGESFSLGTVVKDFKLPYGSEQWVSLQFTFDNSTNKLRKIGLNQCWYYSPRRKLRDILKGDLPKPKIKSYPIIETETSEDFAEKYAVLVIESLKRERGNEQFFPNEKVKDRSRMQYGELSGLEIPLCIDAIPKTISHFYEDRKDAMKRRVESAGSTVRYLKGLVVKKLKSASDKLDSLDTTDIE